MNYTEELLRSGFIDDCRQTLPQHRGKSWSVRSPSKIRGMVLHQSLEETGSAHQIARYHVGVNHISNGLPGMSYTLFVERDGRVVLANDVEAKTWSQGYVDPDRVDENAIYMGVCVGGNFSGPGYAGTQRPTKEQMESVGKLWELCRGVWGWSGDGLYGHFHFGKPACPGGDLLEYIYSQRPLVVTGAVNRQDALRRLGWYFGEVDGVWGPDSKAALVEFQTVVGLRPDGVWGPQTTTVVREMLK